MTPCPYSVPHYRSDRTQGSKVISWTYYCSSVHFTYASANGSRIQANQQDASGHYRSSLRVHLNEIQDIIGLQCSKADGACLCHSASPCLTPFQRLPSLHQPSLPELRIPYRLLTMSGGSIDINAPGKYPIVLSDALLGKTSKESYTSIRCK